MQFGETDIKEILIGCTLILFGFTVLILFLVIGFNKSIRKKQQESFKLILNAIEIERTRIGQDLHDDVGPLLSSIKLNMHAFSSFIKEDEELQQTHDIIRSSIDNAVISIRSASHNLMPSSLVKYGIINALTDYCNSVSNSESFNIEFKTQDFYSAASQNSMTNLYRVSHELINNVIKHSGASKLIIELKVLNNKQYILLEDNGIGFDYQLIKKTEKGIGLSNIESRINLLNGRISYTNAIPSGCKVEIIIPINNLK